MSKKENLKKCSRCGQLKTLDDFYFDKARGKPQAMCKKCKIKKILTYYDPAKARERYRFKVGKDA